jgi:hypothetical protein
MPGKIHKSRRMYCKNKKVFEKTTYFILYKMTSHIALNNEISSQPLAPPPILSGRQNLLSRTDIDSGANRRVVAAPREQISKWDSCLKRIRVTARWQGRHLQCAFRESLNRGLVLRTQTRISELRRYATRYSRTAIAGDNR